MLSIGREQKQSGHDEQCFYESTWLREPYHLDMDRITPLVTGLSQAVANRV